MTPYNYRIKVGHQKLLNIDGKVEDEADCSKSDCSKSVCSNARCMSTVTTASTGQTENLHIMANSRNVLFG